MKGTSHNKQQSQCIMPDPVKQETGVGAGGAAALDQVVMNLPIPALKPDERIEEWQPLFEAGVRTLVARGTEGEVLAIGLLPAYINRRTAERELVKEVVRDCTKLVDAFKVLVDTLDPPVDKYQYIQEMCRLDWVPGVLVDDYFFELKRLGVKACADVRFVCSLFVSQLPKEVQNKAKSWLADCDELVDSSLRAFVKEVKGWLVERGLPLNRGSRHFVGAVRSGGTDQPGTVSGPTAPVHDCSAGPTTCELTPTAEGEDREVISPKVFALQKKKGRGPRCYICDSPDHLMNKCPSRHCAKCGRKGHSARDCGSRQKVYHVTDGGGGTSEQAVTMRVQLDGSGVAALLDSGASMSVIDERSVLDANLGHKVQYSNDLDAVSGVGGQAVVIGSLSVRVNVGDGQAVRHSLKVLGGVEPIVILGRDFLSRFPSTEFDWEGGRIRLGNKWKAPDVMIAGGKRDDRAAVAVLESMVSPSASELRSRINPALDPGVKERIFNVLWEHRSVFAVNPKKPTQTTVTEHEIETGDARPVKQRSSRMSPEMEKEVNKQMKEMLDNGICRPSSSPWSSRVILVRKKDSSYRFVVDYRDLNKVTKKDAYPAANWQDILDKMAGSRVFSFLDGASAYWSVPIREEDREKTAFAVPRGQFEMNVMAFGLCNSQSTYQRVIDQVLAAVPQVEAYIDDACVHTRDVEDHVTHLKLTLDAYKNANMQLRLDKCQFAYEKGEFVGHEISGEGYSPLKSHVTTIRNYPKPNTKKELQRFLGLVNFYRHFIPEMGRTAAPLYKLTHQDSAWLWTEECEVSFEALRKALVEQPVLAFPKWNQPFWVEVDASSVSVGGILSQETENGVRKPLAYFSSGLTGAQRNYSASELECWALVAAVRKWNTYLRAAPKIVLVTDHNPLVWLRKQRDPRHKFARWLMELESYSYEIVYRKGAENAGADCLSRVSQPADAQVNDEDEHFERHVYKLTSSDLLSRVVACQKDDPVTMFAVSQLIANGRITRGRYRNYRDMLMRGGALMKGERLVVPATIQREVVEFLHRAEHLGVEKTLDRVKQQYFSLGLPACVRSVCAECLVCSANKRSYQPEVEMQPYVIGELTPRKTVAMDVGTLPWSASGYRYFLVVVDIFSRYAEFIPMKDQTADSVLRHFMSGWVYNHGLPEILVTDQARNMDGETMNRFCTDFNIQKRRSSPYHPEGNGLAERCVQAGKQLLRCLLAEREMSSTEWPELMKEVTFVFNSARNSSTKLSPHEVMYGVSLRPPQSVTLSDPSAYVSPEDHVDESQAAQQETYHRLCKSDAQAKSRSKQYYDRARVSPSSRRIVAGDQVMVRVEERSGLDPMFRGPYPVIRTVGANVVVRVGDSEKCVHMNRVKVTPSGTTAQAVADMSDNTHQQGDGDETQVGPSHAALRDTTGREEEDDTVENAPGAAIGEPDHVDPLHPSGPPSDPISQAPDPADDPFSFLPTTSRSGRVIQRNPRYTQ